MKYTLFSKSTNINVTDTATQNRTESRTAGHHVKYTNLVLRMRGGCCSTRGIEWGNQGQYNSRGRSSRSRSGNCGGGGGGSSGGDGGGGGCGGGGGGGGGNGGG